MINFVLSGTNRKENFIKIPKPEYRAKPKSSSQQSLVNAPFDKLPPPNPSFTYKYKHALDYIELRENLILEDSPTQSTPLKQGLMSL